MAERRQKKGRKAVPAPGRWLLQSSPQANQPQRRNGTSGTVGRFPSCFCCPSRTELLCRRCRKGQPDHTPAPPKLAPESDAASHRTASGVFHLSDTDRDVIWRRCRCFQLFFPFCFPFLCFCFLPERRSALSRLCVVDAVCLETAAGLWMIYRSLFLIRLDAE
jgi:hypothetical protein